MDELTPHRLPEPTPFRPLPGPNPDPPFDPADPLRPLVAVLVEIATRVERELAGREDGAA